MLKNKQRRNRKKRVSAGKCFADWNKTNSRKKNRVINHHQKAWGGVFPSCCFGR